MAFWSGNGGTVTVDGDASLAVSKSEIRKTARLAEVTNSGTAATLFRSVVPHYEWTIEVVWDDASLPDTDVGLEEGAIVAITFKDGASAKTCALANTTVESLVQVIDDVNDVVRAVITGRGGTLTREAT